MPLRNPKRRKLDDDRDNLQEEEGYVERSAEQWNAADTLLPDVSTTRMNEGIKSESKALFAGELYNSSMFMLQVDEMLSNVRPDDSKLTGIIDKSLRKLKCLIEKIEDREPLTVVEAAKHMQKAHKITIPYPDPKPDRNAAYKLAYSQPTDINVVGSYALHTIIKRNHILVIDMVVTMPESIFQQKDYLNYRYYYKRAYYLACLAAGLQEGNDGFFDLSFDYLGQNSLQPILVVKSRKAVDQGTRSTPVFHVQIIPAAPSDYFLEIKLRPDKNAVRFRQESADRGNELVPTPFYNATLRADSNISSYSKLLNQSSKHVNGFRDACILGRVWLRQRGLGSSISTGGFGPFEWTILLALLLQGAGPKGDSILSPAYSSYQLFKGVIQFLASTNLITDPVLFQAPEIVFPKLDTPVFYDGPRNQNLLFKMTPWSYSAIVEEVRITLEMLDDSASDNFGAIFILSKDEPLQKFDCIFHLPVPGRKMENVTTDHKDQSFLLTSRIYELLKEGLTDRVKVLELKVPGYLPWPLKSSPSLGRAELVVGVIFDPANIDRLVDHGPPAEEKESALRFRRFWGEKAELRRFKDGRILESIVWSNSSRGSIFRDIVNHVLRRHLGQDVGENVKIFGNDSWDLLPVLENGANPFNNLREAFHVLERDIKAMDSLPLRLKLLSATSPQLRLTSLRLPDFTSQKYLREPAEITIQLEGSGKWPDDIIAIHRAKIAFLLKIGSLLESSVSGLVSRLGLENLERPLCNCAMLDVMYPSGATFRLRICTEREQTLLERRLEQKPIDLHGREGVSFARSLQTRICRILPLHTQSIATYCTRHPLLSPTIRLVKKWFDSHMLSGHIEVELVELIVVRIFLQPYPWRAPTSSGVGLLRTLKFLSRWDWRTTPLIVDFNGTMSSDNIAAINMKLGAWRKVDPGMTRTVLFAASTHDMSGTAFTRTGPSKVVASRMTALARSACLVAKDQGLKLDVQRLFTSSTEEYDFVLHINSNLNDFHGLPLKSSSTIFKNLTLHKKEDLSLLGFDPVQLFLEELNGLYSSNIVFFYSKYRGLVIGGLWNPQTASRLLKSNLTYVTKPMTRVPGQDEEQHIEIDKKAILSDIARLGGDMITRIEIHK